MQEMQPNKIRFWHFWITWNVPKKTKKNKNMLISSWITLRCAKQDIDSAGAMHLVLLGYDDGKRSTSSAYILQCLS